MTECGHSTALQGRASRWKLAHLWRAARSCPYDYRRTDGHKSGPVTVNQFDFTSTAPVQRRQIGRQRAFPRLAWIAVPLAFGCTQVLKPAPDRGTSETDMASARSLQLEVPERLRPITIHVAPVRLSAAPPGRPDLFRGTLERCLRGSLLSAAPKVKVDLTTADWVLEVDLQRFGRASTREERAVTHTGVGVGFNEETKQTDVWRVEAAATLRRTGRGEPIEHAWTALLEPEESMSSSTNLVLMVVGGTEKRRETLSFAECLAVLAQEVAQESLVRIERSQARDSTPAQ